MNGEQDQEKPLPAALEETAVSAPSQHIEEIFQAHHAKVLGTAYRITGNLGDAEDALQTVFLRLLDRGVAGEPVGKLDGYLHRAAVNAALDVLRRRKHVLALADAPPRSLEDSRPSPDRCREASEIRAFLREALGQLSPRAAEVFVLHYVEGYSGGDIARMIGASRATVAVVLHRTRSRLKKQIRSHFGGIV
jgi:RNA polymerase sigma-70 factor (ECF subfamily)